MIQDRRKGERPNQGILLQYLSSALKGMVMLYARALLLRNCGRFTHVSSDFGSQYHTHTFVTSEALYASLTRGVTWRHASRFVDLEEDAQKGFSDDYFICDYDVKEKPIWFIPGLFVDRSLRPLSKQRSVVDNSNFNVVDEDYPSTGGKRMDGKSRRYYCPTYGRIESVLPDHRIFTWMLSPRLEELQWFRVNQTFTLGKKRTMVQVTELSQVTSGEYREGICRTPYLQVTPEAVQKYASFEILAATARYVLVSGELRNVEPYWEFGDLSINGSECSLSVPEFYLQNKIL
jgi:hypothetical protein